MAAGQTFNVPTAPVPNGWYYNLEKYWWFRYRLINDFLIVGPDCGMSIPAQRRETSSYWSADGRNKLKWGDATLDLGNYISMLATEYKHLKNNNLDCTQTLKELYYALNAFERLDRNAESACYNLDGSYPCNHQDGAPWGNMLNGFFVRDDVPFQDSPAIFHTSLVNANYNHFNRDGIKNLIEVHGVESSAYSDYYGKSAGWNHPGIKRVPTEESQDQLVQMAMGLVLTSAKLNGATYNGENLGAKAAGNLFRTIKHVATYFNNWDIIDPPLNACVYGLNPGGSCFDGGAMAQDIARGAAISMQRWTAPYGYGYDAIPIVTPTNGYYNVFWQALQFVYTHSDAGFWGTMAATSDSWIQKKGLCWGPFQLCWISNSTYEGVRRIAEAHSWANPHLPLVYRWLYGESGVYRPTQYQMLLDAAPSCGIHNYDWKFPGINTGYLFDWTGNDAIHEYYHKTAGGGDNSDCNGLDYMTLYNLYIMEDPAYQQMYFNCFYKTDLNMRVPNAKWGIGTSKSKLTLNYLEYLSTITKADSGGYLTLRGAKVIDFKPGFDAKKGSVFSGYVKDYEVPCGQDIYHPGEAFHHAIINDRPTIYALKGTGEAPADSMYYLDYPPDGEPFVPEDMPVPEDTATDTTVVTCEMQHQYFNELIQQIYESGDSVLIAYTDSVIIPNATFPACDTLGNGGTGNRLSAGKRTDQIQIFPNPNNGQFTIAVPETDRYTVSIRDVMGREVYRDELFPADKLKTVTLTAPPGNYIVIVSGNKYYVTQKIVVQ